MAKANRPTKTPARVPFLEAAFICEQIVKEKDGTYSAIRMVNRITFHEQTFNPDIILFMPLVLVVSFKAGDATDTRHLSIYVTNPSGKLGPLEGYVFPHPIVFAGGDTGAFMTLHNFPIKY